MSLSVNLKDNHIINIFYVCEFYSKTYIFHVLLKFLWMLIV